MSEKMKLELYHMTMKSGNGKTGPIPVTTSPELTCPDACPFKKNGCYGEAGPLLLHWNKVNNAERGVVWSEFLDLVKAIPEGQVWRHNQVGDLPGKSNSIDAQKFCDLVAANKMAGAKGFTYTHKPVIVADFGGYGYSPTMEENRTLIKMANYNGFTVNLSANNLAHADELAALDIGPVAVVTAEDSPKVMHTPEGRKVVRCPADKKKGITCDTCRLCAKPERDFIIGLPVHGTGKRKAAVVAAA